jgi:CRISPR-associated protein Csd1
MILQALVEYYERKRAADPDALPEPGFERKEIPFVIVLSEEGEFLNIEDTREADGEKKRGRRFTVPQSQKRTGTKGWKKAFLLWDHSGYVLGIAPPGKPAESAAARGKARLRASLQHGAFKKRLEETFGSDPQDAGVSAVLRFLRGGDFQRVLGHPLWSEIEATRSANLGFRLADDTCLIAERPAVVAAVRSAAHGAGDKGPVGQCLVTGVRGPIAVLHPAIKGVRGAQTTGANIVSFNLDAFRTHGREQGANAPVSEQAAFAYTTALNRLLQRNSSQKAVIADTTVVFWSAVGNPVEDMAGALFGDDQAVLDDPDKGVEKLKAIYASPWQGNPPLKDDQSQFYILGLAPNASRIAIRFWRPTTVSAFATAVLQHFDDVDILRPAWSRHPSIRSLLRSTAVLGKDDNIPRNLAGALLDAIITGKPYPRTLLSRAVQRIRAEPRAAKPDVEVNRIAIIKACLVRNGSSLGPDHREVQVSLDSSNQNVGYLLGRLFAALERAQEKANPGIQTGIRERYYASASATPTAVFPTLMKLKNYHLAKIENRGAVVNLERLLGSIVDGISDFPSVLPMPDQGRFALGYYHQRQDFYTSKPRDHEETSDA